MCATAPTYPADNVTLAVNSTPIVFTWPAVYGATSYDVYFQGSYVANTTTNSINGGSSYTTANMAALFGVGTDIHWHVVPKNSYGMPECTTEWTFRVGGNGSTNAIPLTEGVAYNGNQRAANGYTNLNSTYWGNDSWYTFSASECATDAEVHLCLPPGASATYLYLVVRRTSDNSIAYQFDSYVDQGECLIRSEFDYDWYYAHYMDPDYEDHWIISTPSFAVQPGESFYVIADAYGTDYDFQVSYTEVLVPDDYDGDGIPDCVDLCPELPGGPGDACDAEEGFENGVIDENCACVGTPIPYDCLNVPHGTALPGTS
jgi:hypothetical protein